MAENKKSFILYADLLHTVKKLPDEKAGKLLKHILEYVNDNNPITDDMLVDIVFEPIKQQLKRDLNKWEGNKTTKSNAGKLGNLKRYELDIYKDVINKKITLDEGVKLAETRKMSHSEKNVAPLAVSVNVNDNVNVTINSIFSFERFWNLYDKKVDRVKTEKKWSNLKDKDKSDIMAYLPKYNKSQPVKKYRKNPMTFLNNEIWKNEIIIDYTIKKNTMIL